METNENQNDAMKNAATKNRTTAALLAILLGDLGLHEFYLGNTVLGIVFLLTCWSGIPWLIAIIQGIIWLTKTDAEFHQMVAEKRLF